MRRSPRVDQVRRFGRLAGVLATGLIVAAGGGCSIIGFGGAMIESSRRHSTRTVEAEYTGLTGKKWAVVVAADRVIQADHPAIVAHLTRKITERLADPEVGQKEIGAAGCIPADTLLAYLYENPRWVTMPRGTLAKELGVDRLIYIDLIEYRLNDPGNQYLWAGLATGSVGVIEADSAAPDEFAFEKQVTVRFPDKDSYNQEDYNTPVVSSALAGRFIDRASWLFYKHLEPYYPKY